MSHIKYSMILDRTFIEKPFPNEKPFKFENIKMHKIHFLTFRMKDGFENHRILEIFFRFEQKKHHVFYINFYYDPDVGTWERKEVRHLSKNPLYDIKNPILYTSKYSKKIEEKTKKQIEKHVLQHKTIRNLPLFK
ncbi:TPA: hypothetical protein ACG05V_005426 [Bacillus pacificus]|uniref:hypothetical protein n=1 Tax=Bacillus cereus group TaxID=86661 RepID=UPI0029C42298|nr:MULTISPECIES: hypothetical protein [unclassified Bacillus cereus group]MDX5840801.1 hypothetical protein [Bacillus cereus group sp. BfR-BA-01700]MDX5846214.1 hypothetical protein [Bacillus cereus group sp. BfR-BA-01233]MDX5941828.1 hypothetical protein [Bacillus cereus group sp. BfR-BA-00415]